MISCMKSVDHPYTEALLSAIPQVDQGVKTERIHLGEVPSVGSAPQAAGSYASQACDRCRQEVPWLKGSG